jgi:hypothetical protein
VPCCWPRAVRHGARVPAGLGPPVVLPPPPQSNPWLSGIMAVRFSLSWTCFSLRQSPMGKGNAGRRPVMTGALAAPPVPGGPASSVALHPQNRARRILDRAVWNTPWPGLRPCPADLPRIVVPLVPENRGKGLVRMGSRIARSNRSTCPLPKTLPRLLPKSSDGAMAFRPRRLLDLAGLPDRCRAISTDPCPFPRSPRGLV